MVPRPWKEQELYGRYGAGELGCILIVEFGMLGRAFIPHIGLYKTNFNLCFVLIYRLSHDNVCHFNPFWASSGIATWSTESWGSIMQPHCTEYKCLATLRKSGNCCHGITLKCMQHIMTY